LRGSGDDASSAMVQSNGKVRLFKRKPRDEFYRMGHLHNLLELLLAVKLKGFIFKI